MAKPGDDTITLALPTVNWEGMQPTSAQVFAAAAFWDVHGYRPVLALADMFPHECARCRAHIEAADARLKATGTTADES